MNRLVLSARIVERKATRYTPAGLPAVDLTLAHQSEVSENGQTRKIALELRAIGIGNIAERLAKLSTGDEAGFAGFLGAQRNGKGTLFHITEFERSSVEPV